MLLASAISTTAVTGASWFIPLLIGIIIGFVLARKIG